MHPCQQVIQGSKARGHTGNPPLQAAEFLNVCVGVIQHLFYMHQGLTAGAVHHNIKDGLFRMVQRFLQRVLLAVAFL